MADEIPTIHIEAVQFTPCIENVLIHCNINGMTTIVHTTQSALGWPPGDPEVVAAAELGIKKKLGADLKVKLPLPEAPSL